jgi:DNA-binding MarR family transcriptional regulator
MTDAERIKAALKLNIEYKNFDGAHYKISAAAVKLDPIFRIMDEARRIYPSMTVTQLMVFCLVAANPYIGQADLEVKTGISDASASRIVALLSQHGNRGTEPLNLISLETDPKDRRRRIMTLTSKGERFIELMLVQLERYTSSKTA